MPIHIWQYTTIYDKIWQNLTGNDKEWQGMTGNWNDREWQGITIYDKIWQYMTINDNIRQGMTSLTITISENIRQTVEKRAPSVPAPTKLTCSKIKNVVISAYFWTDIHYTMYVQIQCANRWPLLQLSAQMPDLAHIQIFRWVKNRFNLPPLSFIWVLAKMHFT